MNAYTVQSNTPSKICVVDPKGSRREISCRIENFDGKRLILGTGEPLPVSSVVSVEHADALFLGEIVNCGAASGDRWSSEVRVEQVLSGLQSLLALRARLLGESVAQVPSLAGAR